LAVAQPSFCIAAVIQKFVLGQKIVLSEKSMQIMDALIPELAGHAVHRAYYPARTTSGKVLEAVNGPDRNHG